MSQWPAAKASRVMAALTRLAAGPSSARRALIRRSQDKTGPNFVFAFHDSEEIGPRMLARIAKRTGLTPNDL
jgi:hypothetical protein